MCSLAYLLAYLLEELEVRSSMLAYLLTCFREHLSAELFLILQNWSHSAERSLISTELFEIL